MALLQCLHGSTLLFLLLVLNGPYVGFRPLVVMQFYRLFSELKIFEETVLSGQPTHGCVGMRISESLSYTNSLALTAYQTT